MKLGIFFSKLIPMKTKLKISYKIQNGKNN